MFRSRATRSFTLLAAALGALVSTVSSDRAAQANGNNHGSRILYDNFKQGFSVGAPDSKWFYFSAGPYVGDGGVVSTGPQGMHVDADGVNASTGLPAFSNSLAQEHENGGLPGGVDHVKWLAYMNHAASSGYPGFDAVPGREVACESWIGGETYGTEDQPFGPIVANPNDDLRLAAFAANSIDLETFMVFDWFITNETIYAFYERLPFGRGPVLGNYAAFSFSIPVAANSPGEMHHYKTAYDKSKGTVRWVLDGEEVFRVDQIGMLIDRQYMTLDHGGTEGIVSPNQIDCGMGLFTLLDAHQPSGVGLVQLSDSPGFYYDPELGQPNPESFLDSQSLESNRLFGQGASMDVKKYVVSSRPSQHGHGQGHGHDDDGHDDDCDH